MQSDGPSLLPVHPWLTHRLLWWPAGSTFVVMARMQLDLVKFAREYHPKTSLP